MKKLNEAKSMKARLTEIKNGIAHQKTKEATYAKRDAVHERSMMQEKKEIHDIMNNATSTFILGDESTFNDRLKVMGLELESDTYSKYITLQGECNTKARDAKMCPNNNQFACAVYITENLKANTSQKKIMLSMPPGEGKSRITVALLYLMLK